MNVRKLFLSKWLYYSTIAVALLILFFYFLPLAWEGHDIATNFLSEIWGLFFMLAIFLIILDFREWLEWKSVEDRVKKKIGRKIGEIFSHFSLLCVVKKTSTENTIQEISDMQLSALASEEVKLNAVYKKWLLEEEDERSYHAWFAEASRAYLAEIEHRYSKFLDSELLASLMDIQDYLEKLRWELRLMPKRKEELMPQRMKELMPQRKALFVRSISDLIGKIMREIQRLKRKGMWINW